MKKDNSIYWIIGIFGLLLITLIVSGGYILIPYVILGAAFYIIPEIIKRKRIDKYQEQRQKETPEAEKKKPEAEKKKPEADRKKPEADRKKPEADQKKPEADQKKPEVERKQVEAERKLEEERRAAEAESFVCDLQLTLGDLMMEGAEGGAEPFALDHPKLAEYADLFFRGNAALSLEGNALSEEKRIQVIRSILQYASSWSCRPSRREPENISCKPGEIVITYFETEIEVSCYDGGNCGTDFVKRVLRLRCQWKDMDRAAWQEKEELWKKGIAKRYAKSRMSLDQFAEGWIRDWGYQGELESESAPVIIPGGGYGNLHLWNPFGLKGVLVFSHDRW